MLCAADTIGVFQVESRAQMATLPRLQPRGFYDLVVQVAIIRPGPIVGQMVHPYLNRRAGREPVVYDHPLLEPVLARTLGVPLFQEQLLRMAMVVAGFSGGQAEELRRAMGFKRSEQRMRQLEVHLRDGMAKHGISKEAADRIVLSITSFALYGFPESHAASFALLAYASAYLKLHFPAAFYAALLNNQPMGFYHPATLVKDAQRRGVRFAPIDVQVSDWNCTVTPDGAIRLGLRYVSGLREAIGRAIERTPPAFAREPHRASPGEASTPHSALAPSTPHSHSAPSTPHSHSAPSTPHSHSAPSTPHSALAPSTPHSHSAPSTPHSHSAPSTPHSALAPSTPHSALRTLVTCPKCHCDDPSMIERGPECFCNVCSHQWTEIASAPRRFSSIEDLVRRTGLRRDEITMLAEVGALNSFGMDRRTALWQVERIVRPPGELFEREEEPDERPSGRESQEGGPPSPLASMTPSERLVADYAGTGLTIGPHPMAFRRHELSMRGIMRAIDLPRARSGRRVRTAGMVITRQRPGTAKGFVFLTLEDETGVANVIVRPDFYDRERVTLVEAPFLIVEGIVQTVDGATAIKAERVFRLEGLAMGSSIESHDFH
jgi:error-prone DNA polymerase